LNMSRILYSCISFTNTANASSSGIWNTTHAPVGRRYSSCSRLHS
jgi:hypothetical protein